MDSAIFSLITFAILLRSTVATEECDAKKMNNFLECNENKIEKDLPRWTPDLIKEVHDNVDKCFTSNDCEKPEYERDIFTDLPPNMQTLIRKTKSEWVSSPKEIKECIMDGAKDGIKVEVNRCLVERSLAPVNDVPEEIIKHAKQMFLGNENKVQQKLIEQLFTAKTNTARAIRICGENKGKEAEEKVWNCFQDVRQKYLFSQMCEAKKSCANKTLDEVCIKRGVEIENATCQCTDENREIILDNLTEMKNKNFDIETVLAAMAKEHNVTELVGKVKDCYENHNATTPLILKYAEAIRKAKDSGSAPKVRLNANTVNTIRDIVNAAMDDEKCYVCHDKSDADASVSLGSNSTNVATDDGHLSVSDDKNSTQVSLNNSTNAE